MLQDEYNEYVKTQRKDVALKIFIETPDSYIVKILCDGNTYEMECDREDENDLNGDWFPEGWENGDPFPEGHPENGDILYHNQDFILIMLDFIPYAFSTRTYEPLEMKATYLYDIIFIEEKTYILVDYKDPKLYVANKIWESPSQIFFTDEKGDLYHGYISEEDYGDGGISYGESEISADFIIEPMNDLLNKLITMKKEACC